MPWPPAADPLAHTSLFVKVLCVLPTEPLPKSETPLPRPFLIVNPSTVLYELP